MIKQLWDKIRQFFIDEEFNERMNQMENEVVKEEKVDPRESSSVVPKSFTKTLVRKGFTYNSNNKRWARVWTTPTIDAEERTLEVYERKDDGEWISLMYSNEGGIYYRQSVGYEE